MKILLLIFLIALGYLSWLNYGCESAGAMGWEGKYCIIMENSHKNQNQHEKDKYIFLENSSDLMGYSSKNALT